MKTVNRSDQVTNLIAHRAEKALNLRTLVFKDDTTIHACKQGEKITLCGIRFKRAGTDENSLASTSCPVCAENLLTAFMTEFKEQTRLYMSIGASTNDPGESPLLILGTRKKRVKRPEPTPLFDLASIDPGRHTHVV